MLILALYPGRVGGERRPGIDCLRMRDHSQKNLGIRLRLEIVGKINTYTSDIFPYHGKIQPFASRITFNSMNVEDNRRVYEAKDAFFFLQLVLALHPSCPNLPLKECSIGAKNHDAVAKVTEFVFIGSFSHHYGTIHIGSRL